MKEKETKRSLQARETQIRIFNAALKLFSERDMDRVSMSDIAEAAQCSPGNIYHYFKSKEEIALKTLVPLDEAYSDFYKRLQEEEPYRSMPAAEKLTVFFCETVHICTVDTQLQSSYVLAVKNPQLGMLRMTENREFHKICTELLRQMKQEGNLSENVSIEKARNLLLCLLRGVLVEWIISCQEFDAVERARMSIDALMGGIRK